MKPEKSVRNYLGKKNCWKKIFFFVQDELDLALEQINLQQQTAKEKEDQLLKEIENKNRELSRSQPVPPSIHDSITDSPPESPDLSNNIKLLEDEINKLTKERSFFEEKCTVMAVQLKRLCDALEEHGSIHERLISANEENLKMAHHLSELEDENAMLCEELRVREEDNAVLAADNDDMVVKFKELGLQIKIKHEDNKISFEEYVKENLEGLSIDELLNG